MILLTKLFMALGLTPIRTRKGSTPNKYKPHQGKQECARRRRQS